MKKFFIIKILNFFLRRFTRMLAQKAESVIAVDFIEKFIQKNRELNSDLNNIEYITGDVTKLTFEHNS